MHTTSHTTYPQETLGTTLLEVEHAGEYRRVFVRDRRLYVEVGEFTRGPLTQELCDAPVHYHAIHLSAGTQRDFAGFFAAGEPYLADLMDALDNEGTPYGYLNSMAGSHVTFRPA